MEMNKLEKEAMVQGINCFIFYSWNYDQEQVSITTATGVRTVWLPRALVHAKWNCDISHIADKWFESTKHGDSHSYFIRFYAELSSSNRRALLEWVIENYKDGQRI
jgi:hypothetical protein